MCSELGFGDIVGAPKDAEGRYLYRCQICGIPFNSQREADLCTQTADWDIVYGPDAFLHPNNNYDEMYQWKDE